MEQKINKFDYAEADLIALNADKDCIIYSTILNWQKMKMKMKKISSANQQLSASGNATGINAFKMIKNVYPLPLNLKVMVKVIVWKFE